MKHTGAAHLTLDDLDELVRLHGEYLNYGQGIRPHFAHVLRDPQSIALKYMVEDVVAGIFIYTEGIALSGKHAGLEERIKQLSAGKRVYTGDAVLVKREYRRLGVADKLLSAMIEELRRRGAELLLHEFWVHPDGKTPAYRMFSVFTDSVFLGRFENFYRDYHHFGYICPICGKHCVCAAQIYLAQIPEVLK